MVKWREAGRPLAEPLLEVDSIEVVYNRAILALRGVSLSVPGGSIVALLGANGAGKSTTLKAISGLLPARNGSLTAGEIRWRGESIKSTPPDAIVRRGIVQVMEGRRIIGNMTCRENLRVGAHTRRDRGIERDIEMVYHYFPRLKERAGPAGYLSGGEQQMLAVGRALMARPTLLLLDEPSMGLSPRLVREVLDIIRRMNTDLGLTILLVEQNATLALELASSGYIIEHGRVVLTGSSVSLAANPHIKRFYLGPPHAELRKLSVPLGTNTNGPDR